MTAQEMWARYAALHPEHANEPCEAWAYGDAPDILAALTLSGVKCATSSAHALYALAGEELPRAGEFSVLLNSRGDAVCILRNTQVQVHPFREVDERHAFLEGEGDRSLSYWRQVHEAFFRSALAAQGLPFTDDISVVCEEFEVVYQ